MTVVFVAPAGTGDGSDDTQPCSLETAQDRVRSLLLSPGDDIVVELADGVYRLREPLIFRPDDAGGEDRLVRWVAAARASPVICGSQPVADWRLHSQDLGIWVAETPLGVDSRQLYVNGVPTPRAARHVAADEIEIGAEGITILSAHLEFLNDLPQQHRIEFESKGDFTYRYSPVASIADGRAHMAQPAWDNNTWGWDTPQYALMEGATYWFSNSLAFLDQMGEWYLDPEEGRLYYKPGEGVDPNALHIELPRLETLLSIGGTYDRPLIGLAFDGVTFAGTSWLGPSVHGYASQQNGSYLRGEILYRPTDAFTGCSRGCEEFERTRASWYQQPAAVQVSAASRVAFENNLFTNLGSSALGIGNDANATLSGVGLGAARIDVVGNRFAEVAGHGICIGGIRADAHHPSDPRMLNRDITVADNTITRVAVHYQDNSGILSTYVTDARIIGNEVANVAYDGIDTGYGWGINDVEGSDEYTRRGYFRWNQRYATPTSLKNNLVAGNRVHNTKSRFADGGSIYNLSATPGSVTERNYVYNAPGVGLYLDEGTRFATYRNNVLKDMNPWVFTNTFGPTNTSDNAVEHNWFTTGNVHAPRPEENRNRFIDNVRVTGEEWPAEAREVMGAAGVAPARRTVLNGNFFSEDPAYGDRGVPVSQPFITFDASVHASYFAQSDEHFAVRAAGACVWRDGDGDSDRDGDDRADEYGAIYQRRDATAELIITARVDTVGDADGWAGSGVMVRDDITAPGVSAGYAIVAVTPRHGIVFQWDADGDGYLDAGSSEEMNTSRPIWVRLVRTGTQVSAFFSFDGANFAQVGSTVALASSAVTRDAGLFSTSGDRAQSAVNVFSEVAIEQRT